MTRFWAWSDKWLPILFAAISTGHLLFGNVAYAAAGYAAACLYILLAQRGKVDSDL